MNDVVDSPKAAAFRRLYWRCRRGFLENDLLLQHFLQRDGESLDDEEMERLNHLLDCDDPTLWELLSGRARCEDEGMQQMVERIRAA